MNYQKFLFKLSCAFVCTFLTTIISVHAQSVFEIDGAIQASGLANEVSQNVVADTSGMLVLDTSDPAILELKDSTGDVRFRFDANQGLFQMLLRGDTLREIQSVIIPAQVGQLITNKTNIKAENASTMAVFANKLNSTLLAISDKLKNKLGMDVVQFPETAIDKEMNLRSENGVTVFGFDEGGPQNSLIHFSGEFDQKGNIQEIEIDVLGDFIDNTLTLKFFGGRLLAMKFQDEVNLKDKKAFFNENCDVISEEEFGLARKILLNDPSFLTSLCIDGNQIKTTSQTGPENSVVKATEVVNFSPGGEKAALGFGKMELTGPFGNLEDKAEFGVNHIVHKDEDNGTKKSIGIEAKPADSLYVICANLQVKGTITATGGINGNQQSFLSSLPKKMQSFVGDLTLSGNVTTDTKGKALIEVEEVIHKTYQDFRYQLTTIGSFAKAIVLEELQNGTMVVATDEPNTKVSWLIQATAIHKHSKSQL